MSSIIIPLDDDLYEQMHVHRHINWSAVARDEARKKRIFEEYMETHEVTAEDWKFCEEIDWHPVDELPLKKSFIRHLENIRKSRKTYRYSDINELKKDLLSE